MTDSFKIISITGAHSSVGKTTLGSILLKELKGFGAIKFTKTPLYVSVTDDTDMLDQPGKDTAVFLESGAERVIWVQSPRSELENVLEIATGKVSDLAGVVIEGNSPVDFLNPHLVVFITGTEGKIKPSAVKVSKKADVVIVNSVKQAGKEVSPLEGVKTFWIDLLNRKGEIEEFLSFVKEKISPDADRKKRGG